MRGERRTTANRTRPRRSGRPAARRRGFTLVEMLVSVTLVLMMMLMFAEIYGLAQGTISTQKGIAENDQKARILSEVLRRDLDTRTFRSVYPFKLEPDPAFASVTSGASQLIDLRRGYFSISENDWQNDTDDVLQMTVEVDQPGYGGAGDRHYGKAGASLAAPKDTGSMRSLPTPPASATVPLETEQNHPEYDDGIRGNGAGASDAAEISYFLRNGNLYRSVLLIRKPYIPEGTIQPPIDPAWLSANANPYANYTLFSTQYPTTPATYPTASAPPNAPRSVWGDYDYSVFRQPTDSSLATYEWRFHGVSGLSNNPSDLTLPPPPQLAAGADQLLLQPALGVPHLRFGAELSLYGRPLEKSGSQFFGRFTVPERAGELFAYPGTAWAPFDGTIPADADSDGLFDFNAPGTPIERRGVDLMLSNVHSFDIEVWDDVLGRFVDLGYDNTDDTFDKGTNPYTGAVDQFGFYHISRRRNPFPNAGTGTGPEQFHYDHPGFTEDFENRYDTWHPQMLTSNTTGGRRTGRAPYRPQRSNPDPNDPEFNKSATDGTATMAMRESLVAFGDDRLDDDNDGVIGSSGDSDAEAPLRAVRIVIRYLDTHSGQMRQATLEHSLID